MSKSDFRKVDFYGFISFLRLENPELIVFWDQFWFSFENSIIK